LTQYSFKLKKIESSFKSSTQKIFFYFLFLSLLLSPQLRTPVCYRYRQRPLAIDNPEYIQTINGRHVIIFGTFGDKYEADVLEWDWFWLRKRSEKY